MTVLNKAKYLLWSATHTPGADRGVYRLQKPQHDFDQTQVIGKGGFQDRLLQEG